MEMYDKVSRPSERCRMCGHERLKYYEFPCKDCVYNGGGGDMFVAKETLSSAGTIKDSGERRVFQTGAVRDCAEGKGRMDLIPWNAVLEVSKHCERGAAKMANTTSISDYRFIRSWTADSDI